MISNSKFQIPNSKIWSQPAGVVAQDSFLGACLKSSSRREEAPISFVGQLEKPGCLSLLMSAATAKLGFFTHALT